VWTQAKRIVEAKVQRRLAAILAVDVAGYLRLMGVDESTPAALKELRHDLADPKIKEHRGRIAETIGDGFLVEFANVVRRGALRGRCPTPD
jgi:adenylate cyclase